MKKTVFTLITCLFFHPLIAEITMDMLKNFYCNKQVLVTGGAGFIGSHLVEQLVQLGARVTVLDDLSTGSLTNLTKVHHAITFIHATVTDHEACINAAAHHDIIFHCAALVSVPESIEQPSKCHEINVSGTAHMLEAARINQCERFIFSSSAAVYGPQSSTCVETMACTPTSPYGYSKYIGELYCRQYSQTYGLLTGCARYFNVFGERQRADSPYSGVISRFQKQLALNEPLTIFGDGSQQRDFVPVAAVVQANLILGALPPALLQGDSYNVATGTSITLLELIEQLKKEFPAYNKPLIFKPARPGDIHYSAASCAKLRAARQQLHTRD